MIGQVLACESVRFGTRFVWTENPLRIPNGAFDMNRLLSLSLHPIFGETWAAPKLDGTS